MRNKPLISTAKVRGLIKKNDIWYVDATRRLYPSIASGLSVWQRCDNVYVRAFGPKWELHAETLKNALNEFGLTLQATYNTPDTFSIVKIEA